MATDKQIAANRLNAQKCTGPRTPEGKAISSQNAFKTGIDSKSEVMQCESREEYDELIACYQDRFKPDTPEEESFVDAMIRYEWLSRRYMALEAGIWNRRFTQNNNHKALGHAFVGHSEDFSRAGQRFDAARRGFAASLKQLRICQEKRAKAPLVPEPEQHGQPESGPTDAAPKPLKPELVSSLQNTQVPEPTTPTTQNDPNEEEDPPIAA